MTARGTIRTEAVMGTLVTIQTAAAHAEEIVERAFGWFVEVEARCSRFSESSELRELCRQSNVPVPASAILFEAVRFALSVAVETGGAFDPTLGRALENRGLNIAVSEFGAYRDIVLDAANRTIRLRRPLTLDLGAVAKGLAIDLAARELAPMRDFAIDAGGDLYLGGRNPDGAEWRVGIRHPRQGQELIACLRVSNQAVCTSGTYERGEHILDGRSGKPADAVASATVVAPNAMLADALATAAFVLGPAEGIQLLNRMGVDGLIVTPALERYATEGLPDAA